MKHIKIALLILLGVVSMYVIYPKYYYKTQGVGANLIVIRGNKITGNVVVMPRGKMR